MKVRISRILDHHPAEHLADDDLHMFVVDLDPLESIDLLDLVHQVPGQSPFPP